MVDAHLSRLALIFLALFFIGENILPEKELLPQTRVPLLGSLHIHLHLRDGHDHVQVERENGPREQHYEGRQRRILEVRELQLGRPELDAPADGRVERRRLEAHGLPVGRLDVLEVVRLHGVVDVDLRV